MRLRRVAKLAMMIVFVTACGQAETEVVLPIDAELDSQFTQLQKETLRDDLIWLNSLNLSLDPRFQVGPHQKLSSSAPPSIHRDQDLMPGLVRWFEEIFGGSSPQDVLKFIDDRTGYYLAPKNSWRENLYAVGSQTESGGLQGFNVGVNMFFWSLDLGKPMIFDFGSSYVRVKDTRVGVIQLTDAFFAYPDNMRSKIRRLNVLVHEARHSDCPIEITSADVRAYEKNPKTNVGALRGCGHLHQKCREGHDYAKAQVEACDSNPWGAYGVSAVFAAKMSRCENCSEEEIQAAMMIAIDQAQRIDDYKNAFRGEKGFPQMRHYSDPVEGSPL